jgi:hypothetical protein
MSFDFNKILKDLQDSAKEFASTGLSQASKALDATATKLKSFQVELEKQAEKVAPKNGETKTDSAKQ